MSEKYRAPEKAEREPNKEALEKAVDIFSTEDLKYREIWPAEFATILELGGLTPLTEHLNPDHAYFHHVASKQEFIEKALARPNIRQIKSVRELRAADRREVEGDIGEYSHRTNVFYPEGLFKFAQDQALGTSTVETYSKKDEHEALLNFAAETLNSLAISFSRTAEARDLFAKYGIDPSQLRYGPDDEDWPLDIPKAWSGVFKSPELTEALRRHWLRYFFKSGKTDDYIASVAQADYKIDFGVVLSPKTKCALSEQQDYPSQATVMSPRIKPKEVIGFIINPDHKRPIDFKDVLGPDPDLYKEYPPGDKSYLNREIPLFDYLTALNQTVFRMPEDMNMFLLSRYPRGYAQFLLANGIPRAKLEKYLGSYYDAGFDKYSRYYDEPGNGERLKQLLGEKDYAEFTKLAKKFFEEHSPVREGETLMTGLTRLAEKHQIPIYTTNGDMLWPKSMKQKEVEKMAEKRKDS